MLCSNISVSKALATACMFSICNKVWRSRTSAFLHSVQQRQTITTRARARSGSSISSRSATKCFASIPNIIVETSNGVKNTSPMTSDKNGHAIQGLSTTVAKSAADQARAAARAFGFSDFESWLTSGGDDRSLILKSGTNKYHIKPQPIDPTHIFRGSCTGNPPTGRGYTAAKELYENELAGLNCEELDLSLRDVFADQRARIKSMFDLPRGAEVILVPSGSDAEYLPLAIARALHPTKKIINGVTQLREIGAGSAPAAVGKYFSSHAPLLGEVPDELEYLVGFEGIDGVTISAREKDGSAVAASDEMKTFVDAAFAHGAYPVVHGVFGGKTGLRDKVMPPSLEKGEKSLGVIDACQGRFSLDELHQWLAQDSLVLFTGSKFYQAPPFCGAILVPPSIADKLRKAPAPGPAAMFGSDGLGGFVTDKELPRCLKSWKPHLRKPSTNNLGLALRWEAGLAGMEAVSNVKDEEQNAAVKEWAGAVSSMVKNEPGLDPWCVERSIVSIRVANNEGGWRSMSELRDLYRWMSMDVSGAVPEATKEEKAALSKVAYIGQPVDVAETHAIVRIALGVESMLSYIEDKDRTLEEDQFTVKKLAAIGKHFETLEDSDL